MQYLKKPAVRIIIYVFLAIALYLFFRYGRSIWGSIYIRIRGKQTVSDVVTKLGPTTEQRLKPYFEKALTVYPPTQITLLAFKQERKLELWSKNTDKWIYIRTYPIRGASGSLGPKLQEGDYQVPEGIYQVVFLNPNSLFHLSMLINYPNEYDQTKAQMDNRTNLGDNIFIHGHSSSIGCLAIGDEAIEELFVLTARIGYDNVRVIIAPFDLRQNQTLINRTDIKWLPELYEMLKKELTNFPVPTK
jgi:murein L,D-transpeptidase YafK